jgi:putative (di)nucleoside polyphosphate hydrolase
MEGEYFRAGVGAVLIDPSGRVLACERTDVPGAWQLPQGGLRPGEDPLEGALREVEEETGVARGELELLARHPEPLVYELPPESRSPKTGRGQVQYWFAFRYRSDPAAVRLPDGGEFRDCRWQSFDPLVDEVVEFRKPVYDRLRDAFGQYMERAG